MHTVYAAGIHNSGAGHWQAIWYAHDEDASWIEHSDWNHVSRDVWVDEMHRHLEGVERPVVIVAHSLGCLMVAEYVARHGHVGIAAAFMVAAPDVSSPAFPPEAIGFRPGTALSLPIPSMLVASSNDPYASLPYARELATQWGSTLREVGPLGHVNAASQLDQWPAGVQLFRELTSGM